MMRNLLWREWREERWRLAFGCVLLIGSTAVGLRARMASDADTLLLVVLLGGFLMPLLVAVGTIGSDREERSLDYLTALPVAPRSILGAKSVVALATVLVPIAGALVVALLSAAGRDMTAARMLLLFGLIAWVAVNLVIWVLAFGAAQPTEARVAVIAIAVLAVWFTHPALAETFTRSRAAFDVLAVPNPVVTMWTLGLDSRRPWTIPLQFAVQGGVLVALWFWTASRLSPGRRSDAS